MTRTWKEIKNTADFQSLLEDSHNRPQAVLITCKIFIHSCRSPYSNSSAVVQGLQEIQTERVPTHRGSIPEYRLEWSLRVWVRNQGIQQSWNSAKVEFLCWWKTWGRIPWSCVAEHRWCGLRLRVEERYEIESVTITKSLNSRNQTRHSNGPELMTSEK